ncbi:MAG TPA: coproporphyrinogen III oxidase, partial [Bradyrhizobium sp.]|nr:coproporphyrinogen III oxidase [Bradyrhizobium sp.]
IGRRQPIGMIEAAVQHLRSAGIRNLSFDLIYGLPLQTAESIRRTCQSVVGLSPDRIACFGYAHLPSLRANQRLIDQSKLPSQDCRADQAEVMAEELVANGYLRIGIDHFAKPHDSLAIAAASKRLHRNFQGYTDDDRKILLGFGASAISSFPEGIVQNISDVPRYVRAINDGALASARGARLSSEDRQRAAIIERLMCAFEADLALLAPDADFSDELAALAPMVEDGLLAIDDRKLVVTEFGRPLVRVIAATFDTARRSRSAQFSSAV